MRIALDATYSVGDNLSGVGIYSQEILLGLAKAHPDTNFTYAFRSHRFGKSFSRKLPPNAHRRLLLAALPSRADLFHGLNQRLDARHYRRAVSTFHDLFVLSSDYSSADFRARFAKQAREAVKRSDLIIAVSAFTASQISDLLGVERSRIRVVHHGIRFPTPQTTPENDRQPIVLAVGAVQRRKNSARLVEAFATVPAPWKLVLAGSAGYGAEDARRAMDRSPVRDRICMPGYVSDQELRALYSRASVFAFPSLDEGFGMPVLEAMAQGIPVLTSNCSALPEIAGGAALLVDPRNTDAIAEGLVSLTADLALREALCSRGKLRAQEFSWDRAVSETWTVYQELLR